MKAKIVLGWLQLVLLVLFVLAGTPHAGAQALGGPDLFSGKGVAAQTNINYFVASAKFRPARVEYIDATSSSAGVPLRFYSAGPSITVTQASALAATNIWVSSTTGLAAGDVIVIRSVSADTYQRAKIVATNATVGIIITNDTSAATLNFALVAGDAVYKMTAQGSKVVGAATVNLTMPGGGIWNFEEGKPGLLEISDTVGTNTLNIVAGVYWDPRRRLF